VAVDLTTHRAIEAGYWRVGLVGGAKVGVNDTGGADVIEPLDASAIGRVIWS
jgi:hypothetical protein